MEAEHEELTRRFDAALKELASLRQGYPDASDKDAVAARWRSTYAKCQADLERDNTLRGEKRAKINALNIELIGQSLPHKGEAPSQGAPKVFTAQMVLHEEKSRKIKSVSERLIAELSMESAQFQAEVDSHRMATERMRPLLFAAGLLTLAGAFAAYAFWRRPTSIDTRPLLAPPPRPALLKTTAGPNIELGPLLGRGAMGEVYAGKDKTLERAVAVKRLRPELCNNHSELERLLAQARLMAGLKHPNIIQVHSVERDGNEAFLVLELAEGRTLAAALAKDGPLAWEDARRVNRAVAEGLDYAHVRGVTHGDLKPSNIMIAPDGRVKVMDFALAYAAKATVSRLTRSDAFGGLPYMSPEQELGDPGPGADAYALAACFYEALTGKRPFPGPDFLAQKRAGQYAAPSTLAKRLPPGADSLFNIAFNVDPERRFPGPAALAAAADSL